jgi:hypothetical protein
VRMCHRIDEKKTSFSFMFLQDVSLKLFRDRDRDRDSVSVTNDTRLACCHEKSKLDEFGP